MAKRKVNDKATARAKRDGLLAAAAKAELSLTDGVRDMREISGMTQEEFAKHRGVSARAVKALELGQGNPTVALLNKIGDFFGLEVAFVPKRQPASNDEQLLSPMRSDEEFLRNLTGTGRMQPSVRLEADMQAMMAGFAEQERKIDLMLRQLDQRAAALEKVQQMQARLSEIEKRAPALNKTPQLEERTRDDAAATETRSLRSPPNTRKKNAK